MPTKSLLAVLVFASLSLATAISQGSELHPGNIAPLAKVSASSTRPEYPLANVNDDRMDDQWSTATGQTSGQWLQLDWDTPHDVCGVVLHATGPWTQTIERRLSLRASGFLLAAVAPPKRRHRSIRFSRSSQAKRDRSGSFSKAAQPTMRWKFQRPGKNGQGRRRVHEGQHLCSR